MSNLASLIKYLRVLIDHPWPQPKPTDPIRVIIDRPSEEMTQRFLEDGYTIREKLGYFVEFVKYPAPQIKT